MEKVQNPEEIGVSKLGLIVLRNIDQEVVICSRHPDS